MAHGTDKADMSYESRNVIIMRRPIAENTVDGFKTAVDILQKMTDFGFRDHLKIFAEADRHHLDKTDMDRIILSQCSDIRNFREVEIPDRDTVDLDIRDLKRNRPVDGCKDLFETVSSGYLMKIIVIIRYKPNEEGRAGT